MKNAIVVNNMSSTYRDIIFNVYLIFVNIEIFIILES